MSFRYGKDLTSSGVYNQIERISFFTHRSLHLTMYQHTFVCAMSNVLSPIIADILFFSVQKNLSLTNNISLLIHLSDRQTIIDLHEFISFTLKIRRGNSIKQHFRHFYFSVKQQNQSKLVQQPTWSGRYSNFHCFLPITPEKSIVVSLTDRPIQLSDSQFHKKILN